MATRLRPADVRALSIADLTLHLHALSAVGEPLLRALARDDRAGARAMAARYRRRASRQAAETVRLRELYRLEGDLRAQGFTMVAGVDEAGVAPLAGPVVAAAVVLPPEGRLKRLDDSKRLSPAQREILYDVILRDAAAVGVGTAAVEEIDALNILQATRLAHRRAILSLPQRPHLVLIDGRHPADVPVPQLVIVDGDATCAAVAAASIVAKVTRDRLMAALAARYPQYGFDAHKGYGTRAHAEAIRRFGITPAHRRSFLPVRGAQERLPIG